MILFFRVWLGLDDLDIESVYRTVEGFTASWANWNPGAEPNGNAGMVAGSNDCASRYSTGQWNDGNCPSQFNFYCETKSKELFKCSACCQSLILEQRGRNKYFEI